MPRIWLSIGSNIEREHNIAGALASLRREFGALRLSRVYESEAVGFSGDAFYNMVVGLDTDLSVDDLNTRMRTIEAAHGRRRGGEKFAPRTLDIDLLTYGDRVISRPGLELPRDEILRYAFVLGPLAEVAPRERHPVDGRTYAELWEAFDRDSQPIRAVDFRP
jgi:2-amino-4-hydroxy-6-hydroxymethyldihydropteridine diphosphokinase